jgi:hypothetical protein
MVKTVVVKKILSDDETSALKGEILPKGYYKQIFDEDIDVKTEDGKYLLRLRKNVLPKKNIDKAYNAMIKHARKLTTTRGVTGGNNGKPKLVLMNNPIASNIIGYFDTLSVRQKWIFKQAKMKVPKCRQTAFTGQHVNQWKNVIPLIKDIDKQYKKLFPKEHSVQHKAAQSTKYVIDNTAFSTITTNLNLQTAVHTDKGDYVKGFGNLVVLEKGKYEGGYTGFPQYGIAVNVRSGDFLGMDVHQFHGNEPIIKKSPDAERLSLVSYLRERIVNNCQNEEMVEESYFEKAKEKAQKMRDKLNGVTRKKKRKGRKNKTSKNRFFGIL